MEEASDLEPSLALPGVWSGRPGCELQEKRRQDLCERGSKPWQAIPRTRQLREEAAGEADSKPRERRIIGGPLVL